jgi:hypothetical protein
MEIKLPSCSNIHLFKHLHLFIDQNHIPIEITTNPETETETEITSMKGGDNNQKPIDPAHILYKPGYTPFSVFSQFVDTYIFQKKKDYNEDIQNQQLLTTLLPPNKDTSVPILEPTEKTPEPEPIIQTHEEAASLFIHIKTKQQNKNTIESIRGTKLFYLYQRQTEDPTICAHLV